MRACFKKSDQYRIGTTLLDRIKKHGQEDPANPGHKAGLYKAVTRGVSDTSSVEAKVSSHPRKCS